MREQLTHTHTLSGKGGFYGRGTAYLSNENDMIQFQYGRKHIRFRGPYSLEYFTAIKEWDNGYLVVRAKYRHNQTPEEEYIDLVPILKCLYIDPVQFLKPIREVRLTYAQAERNR